MIPYFDIKPTARERELLLDAFDSGWWSSGKYVTELEDSLSRYFGTNCLTTSNGTTAIMLAYMALDLKPGDEVIVPGFGFMAAANIAVRLGLKPVFVDVREDTWCLDWDKIKVSDKTRAIVLIHTYGLMCDIRNDLAKQYNLKVIEDCAEAFGSENYPFPAGTLGDIGTLSFQATKTMTTGEGGAVITNNPEYLSKMKLIREHGLGQRGTYNHIEYGLNFRLPNLLAAIGVAQFENITEKLWRRNQIAKYYRDNIKAIHQNRYSELNKRASYWVFAFRTKNRDKLIQDLRAFGIETRPGFLSPNYLNIHEKTELPISDMLSREVISLPTYPELKDEEVEYICQTVNRLL